MSTARWPLQVAVLAKLRAHIPLTAPVYDKVPDNTATPYVSFGPIVEVSAEAHNQAGLDISLTLDIWSDYAGNKEASDILAALSGALHRQPLTVPGWTDVSVKLEAALPVGDPDPDLRHIAAEFRVWLTKE